MRFDDALAQLFQAPHADFVSHRKRLAGELKTAGDKVGAAALLKQGRPPISAWVVNQLWWTERERLEASWATARRVQDGDLGAVAAHKAALAHLRERATALLTAAGNAANDATLRRVDTTLSALAVRGGFEPDPPGALTEDRDPAGFASLGIPAVASGPAAVVEESADASAEAELRAKIDVAHRELALAAERARAEVEAHRAPAPMVVPSPPRQVHLVAPPPQLTPAPTPSAPPPVGVAPPDAPAEDRHQEREAAQALVAGFQDRVKQLRADLEITQTLLAAAQARLAAME